MTRKEEIKNAACTHCATADVMLGFIGGAEWADENPKSPWISVEDGLPTNQKQKIIMRKRTGKCYCGWFDTSLNYFTTIDPSFTKWTINGVTHWMPIPQIEKGGEQ